jgi:hypothetical protein
VVPLELYSNRFLFLRTATPPNAMIFSSGDVRIADLIKAGLGVKLIGIAVILFASTVFLSPVFHIPARIPMLNRTTLA